MDEKRGLDATAVLLQPDILRKVVWIVNAGAVNFDFRSLMSDTSAESRMKNMAGCIGKPSRT